MRISYGRVRGSENNARSENNVSICPEGPKGLTATKKKKKKIWRALVLIHQIQRDGFHVEYVYELKTVISCLPGSQIEIFNKENRGKNLVTRSH